ncbi:GNAT family N-acetyltransferase [Cribrihabitans neustonicus]|uniref:GNAT family N-acetyltransferase n=1 Tax=Cribrihabitans neustonicus TaxID=1429085 RepID=UPI003B595C0B
MTVRPADPGDAVAIARIYNRIVRDTLVTFTTVEKPPEAIAAEIAERKGRYFVAEAGGAVEGLAYFGAFRSGPGYKHTAELTIYLSAGAQGRGLGRALMQRLEQAAADSGIRVLVAGISGANPGAQAFHAALGFTDAGRLPEAGYKHGQWLDLVLMQKNLAAPRKSGPDSSGKDA